MTITGIIQKHSPQFWYPLTFTAPPGEDRDRPFEGGAVSKNKHFVFQGAHPMPPESALSSTDEPAAKESEKEAHNPTVVKNKKQYSHLKYIHCAGPLSSLYNILNDQMMYSQSAVELHVFKGEKEQFAMLMRAETRKQVEKFLVQIGFKKHLTSYEGMKNDAYKNLLSRYTNKYTALAQYNRTSNQFTMEPACQEYMSGTLREDSDSNHSMVSSIVSRKTRGGTSKMAELVERSVKCRKIVQKLMAVTQKTGESMVNKKVLISEGADFSNDTWNDCHCALALDFEKIGACGSFGNEVVGNGSVGSETIGNETAGKE